MAHHNPLDVQIIAQLVEVITAVVNDHNSGLIIDVTPTVTGVRDYLSDIQRGGREPLFCSGGENLPAGLRSFLQPQDLRSDSDRIEVTQRDQTLCFCSPVCLVAHFTQRLNIQITPIEPVGVRTN